MDGANVPLIDAAGLPALERTSGVGRLRVGPAGVAEIYQEGALRLRLPSVPARDRTEVVAINTGGGLTGGDRMDLSVTLDAGSRAVVTTPACEKIYRSAGGDARVTNTVRAGAAARIDWLPQPMIVFDGARIRRRLDIDLAPDAALLAVEGTILGRTAMDEDMRTGMVHDAWRIRRGGTLIFADAFRAAGDTRVALDGAATLGGARAFATALYVAPDAESRLDGARDTLASSTRAAASAWNGMLAVRFLAGDGRTLIDDLAAFLAGFRGASLPRSWLC
jgi:urease accessory protein